MRKFVILYAVAAVALVGVGCYAITRPADAQNAPTAAVAQHGPGWQVGGRDGHGWGDGRDGEHRHRWMMAHKGWGLFYPAADKGLSVSDVQTIAQAILLRHGNHAWKVANVAENPDNTVSFAFTTADGGVVARFAVDTHTGRIRRIA